MKELFETSLPPITISLNFMERDTLLACLKDLAEIKTRYARNVLTPEEMAIAEAQAQTARDLYDRIYDQKKEESMNGF